MIHAPLQPVAFITPSASIGSVLAEFSIIGEGKKPVLTNHARYLSITIIFTISYGGQHIVVYVSYKFSTLVLVGRLSSTKWRRGYSVLSCSFIDILLELPLPDKILAMFGMEAVLDEGGEHAVEIRGSSHVVMCMCMTKSATSRGENCH